MAAQLGAGRQAGTSMPSRPVSRVDASLRTTMALLELVSGEEAVLVRLGGCVAELEAIRRARATLADHTDAEITEAEGIASLPVEVSVSKARGGVRG